MGDSTLVLKAGDKSEQYLQSLSLKRKYIEKALIAFRFLLSKCRESFCADFGVTFSMYWIV